MLKFIKYEKTGNVVVSHRHATIANALIKTWSATTKFSIFKRWSCSAKYIVIDCKKCTFAIKKDIFDCRKRSFAFFKNLESRSPGYMYVRANSVSSLTWTPISFFVCWIYYCLLCRISFSFFLFLTTCPSESFYAFLETKRFQWAHWQIIASSCDQVSFLHRGIRRACAHAISQGPPPTI